MQIIDFFQGLLAPLYALVGSTFDPLHHFGQLIICVLSVLVMITAILRLCGVIK